MSVVHPLGRSQSVLAKYGARNLVVTGLAGVRRLPLLVSFRQRHAPTCPCLAVFYLRRLNLPEASAKLEAAWQNVRAQSAHLPYAEHPAIIDLELPSYVRDWFGHPSPGEFWTTMTYAHMPGTLKERPETMARRGVRFGKALQMTNVLRDCGKDLRIGRCYLPQTMLDQYGLSAQDLFPVRYEQDTLSAHSCDI